MTPQTQDNILVSWRIWSTELKGISKKNQSGKGRFRWALHINTDGSIPHSSPPSPPSLRRLDNILTKRALARNKLDEIKIKSNILRAFGKPEELDEDDDEEDTNIRRSTAEL